MRASAKARAAEIKAHHGEAEVRKGFGGVVDDLVVHGAATQGMGMRDQGSKRGRGLPGVEQRFQVSRGAAKVLNRLHV